MLDPKNPIIASLVLQGYKVAVHGYLQPDGRVKYSFGAKHPKTGAFLQGWGRDGGPEDALLDLGRRAELPAELLAA